MLIRYIVVLTILSIVSSGCSWLKSEPIQTESLKGIPDFDPQHPERGGVI